MQLKKERTIIDKNSMEIITDSRIVAALNSSWILSCKFLKIKFNIAQSGRSHLLLRDKEEEKSMKGLKKFQRNKELNQ